MSGRALAFLDARRARIRRENGGLTLEVDAVITAQLTPRCAYPWSDAGHFVALLDRENETVALVEDLAELEPESRAALEAELDALRFIPLIRRLNSLEFKRNMYTWNVETDRGPRTFRTSIGWGDDPVQRTPCGEVLLTATDGMRYRLGDPSRLTERERQLLETLV